MMDATALERVAERPHDMFLPDQGREISRAPCAGQDLVGHRAGGEKDEGVDEPDPRHFREAALAASFRT